MSAKKIIAGGALLLGLGYAFHNPQKEPIDIVVDDLVDTCDTIERVGEPCGFGRGDLPEEYARINLSALGMEHADKILQERTTCQLLVFQMKENGAIDYVVDRKSCNRASVRPLNELYNQIHP